MKWSLKLEEYSSLISKRLDDFFKEVLVEAERYHSFIGEVYRALREFVMRKGKRIASYTTLITYRGYSIEGYESILNVCCGIELYRHAILVHDDLIDEDVMRRGGKTIHEIFKEMYDNRLGYGTAVFAGNALLSLALKAIISSGFPPDRIREVSRSIIEGFREVNESQILDLLFEYRDVDIEEWYVMASKRAASLFKTTILTGAILASAPSRDIELLKEASMHIGYAFDIQDDIIDLFATKEQYGRDPGKDVLFGKKPLYIVYALKQVDKEELKRLIKERNIEGIKRLIRNSKALDKAKEEAFKHASKAKEFLSKTEMDEGAKDSFYYLIDFICKSLDWYK